MIEMVIKNILLTWLYSKQLFNPLRKFFSLVFNIFHAKPHYDLKMKTDTTDMSDYTTLIIWTISRPTFLCETSKHMLETHSHNTSTMKLTIPYIYRKSYAQNSITHTSTLLIGNVKKGLHVTKTSNMFTGLYSQT